MWRTTFTRRMSNVGNSNAQSHRAKNFETYWKWHAWRFALEMLLATLLKMQIEHHQIARPISIFAIEKPFICSHARYRRGSWNDGFVCFSVCPSVFCIFNLINCAHYFTSKNKWDSRGEEKQNIENMCKHLRDVQKWILDIICVYF